jgi:hypothetical protein
MQSLHTYFVKLGDYKKIMSSSSVKSSVRYSTNMKILSFIFAVILVVGLPSVSARANQEKMSSNKMMVTDVKKSTPFKICIDDSDCLKIGEGDKFACFQFLCYPWQDDSQVAAKDRIPICRKDKDCKEGKECYRHTDKRRVSKGLCLDKLKECGPEPDDGKCTGDTGCCGEVCCEKKYYEQYSKLPCTQNSGCEDLGLGKFCCPQGKGKDSICCNTDPNPPPPTISPQQSKGDAPSIQATAFTSSLVVTFFFSWLM